MQNIKKLLSIVVIVVIVVLFVVIVVGVSFFFVIHQRDSERQIASAAPRNAHQRRDEFVRRVLLEQRAGERKGLQLRRVGAVGRQKRIDQSQAVSRNELGVAQIATHANSRRLFLLLIALLLISLRLFLLLLLLPSLFLLLLITLPLLLPSLFISLRLLLPCLFLLRSQLLLTLLLLLLLEESLLLKLALTRLSLQALGVDALPLGLGLGLVVATLLGSPLFKLEQTRQLGDAARVFVLELSRLGFELLCREQPLMRLVGPGGVGKHGSDCAISRRQRHVLLRLRAQQRWRRRSFGCARR